MLSRLIFQWALWLHFIPQSFILLFGTFTVLLLFLCYCLHYYVATAILLLWYYDVTIIVLVLLWLCYHSDVVSWVCVRLLVLRVDLAFMYILLKKINVFTLRDSHCVFTLGYVFTLYPIAYIYLYILLFNIQEKKENFLH